MANSGPTDESEMDTAKIPASNSVTSDVFRSNLERHRGFVEGRMDPNHGLVDRLRESSAINYNQVESIRAIGVSSDKNRTILDFVLEGNSSEKIDKLRDALRKTKQQHLVNYVEANGVYKQDFENDWPLLENYIKIIDTNLSFLTERIDTASGLLAELRGKDTITQRQKDYIHSYRASCDRNTALLDILQRGSLAEYIKTIEALEETTQKHLAEILRGSGLSNLKEEALADRPTSMDMDTQELGKRKDEIYQITVDMIQRHKDLLKDRLEDTEFGILEKLLANDGLTYQETTAIENCSPNPYDRSKKLIDLVIDKNIVPEFIMALMDTEQMHLVNYLRGDGAYNAEFGDDWPLDESRIRQLNVNQNHLIDIIDPSNSGLIDILFSAEVINERQFRFISEEDKSSKKNKALLSIIRRQSVKDYNSTIDCLVQANQPRAAEILQGRGVIQRVRVVQEGDAATVARTEDAISNQIVSLLAGLSLEEAQSKLQLAGIKLVAAKKGQSIYLYVYCATLEELTALYNLLVSGTMKTIVETLFNKLVSLIDRIIVSYTYSEEEYSRGKAYFEGIGPNHSESFTESEVESSSTLAFDTPLLQPEEAESSSAVAMETDYQKSGESKGGRPALRPDEIIPAIIRNNMDYFTEHIRPRLLVNKLYSLGIIRDERMRHIRSMSFEAEKNYEVLNIIRAASAEDYKRFVQCLRETNQSLIAEVAEMGGVVLKAKVTHEPDENPEDVQKELVAKLNQLHDRAVPKSEEVWRFLSQLKRANIEIVSARWDRGVVMWLWCRSQKALSTLDDLNRTEFEEFGRKSSEESGRTPEFSALLNSLFTLLLSGRKPPMISSVFLDNPDRDVVCQKLSKDFFEAKETHVVAGVGNVLSAAKLESRIYVLCQNPTAVMVFEEGNLTEPRDELPVEGITSPVDMASSNESKCLYITDKDGARVWKIDISPSGNKIDRWLDGGAGDPFTLSVINDGRVVMVKRGAQPSLDIYYPDARLNLHLNLPTNVLIPNHAVETSKGNLIVAYGNSECPNGVCEITKEGQIISRFDSNFEFITGVADNVNKLLARIGTVRSYAFNYLAIDDNDQLYACSDETNELLCLDSRLKLEMVVKKGPLQGPMRLKYVKEHNQLLVIDRLPYSIVFYLNAN